MCVGDGTGILRRPHLLFGGDIQFVLGSIPNSAGTMVLRCFLSSFMSFNTFQKKARPNEAIRSVSFETRVLLPSHLFSNVEYVWGVAPRREFLGFMLFLTLFFTR